MAQDDQPSPNDEPPDAVQGEAAADPKKLSFDDAVKMVRENYLAMKTYREGREGKLTLRAIAKLGGNEEAYQSIRRFEKGERSNPTLDSLVRISNAMGLELWQLFYPKLEPDNLPAAMTAQQRKMYDRWRKGAKDLVAQDEKAVERAASSVRNPKLIGKYSKSTLFDDEMGAPDGE